MPKPEFGKKVICSNCGAKFYDLNRKPTTCPHCGTEYEGHENFIPSNNAKQVFTDDVDTISDNNLVGSDATESIADDEEIQIEDAMSEDTMSLEDTETDDDVIADDVDHVDELEIADNRNPDEIDEN